MTVTRHYTNLNLSQGGTGGYITAGRQRKDCRLVPQSKLEIIEMTPPSTETVSLELESLKLKNLASSETIKAKLPTPFSGRINAVKFLPEPTRQRYRRHGIDVSKGYPQWPSTGPIYLDEGIAVRSEPWEHIERGANADPEKKALFGAAKEVRNLTKYIGTEIVGLQLADLSDQQLDELALLIAERTVVFFRDQDLSPRKQREIGDYFGKVEVHPKVPHVPGIEGTTIIWPKLANLESKEHFSFKHPAGTAYWHADLTHEAQPAGITHLHNDTIPSVGGDTVWVSGYGAYDKLSRPLQQFLDGKKAIYRSAHAYVDRNDPLSGPKFIEREHYLVRTHAATGWKALFYNRKFTTRIVGLEKKESDAILALLDDVYQSNLDLQVRFNWKPTVPGLGTSALWDNRISQHFAVWDYADESSYDEEEPVSLARHGTRVTSLAEKPFFDPSSKSQREALSLPNP